MARFRDQTVEIALGPRKAFEAVNIGSLMRRVAAGRVVSAVPTAWGRSKPPRLPRTPRIVELLRKASEWHILIESGEVPNRTEIARREGITRARITQVMGLLRLDPQIQRQILDMPDLVSRPAITERALRPLARLQKPADQRARLDELVSRA